MLFDIPTRTTTSFSWFVPKSWTLFPVGRELFANHYDQLRQTQPCVHLRGTNPSPDEVTAQLFGWSSRIEKAVDFTLKAQHDANPFVHVQRFLPKTFRGRCATPRLIRATSPTSPKRDVTRQYEPPAETTSLKSRHKTRQVRRLRCLERLYSRHHLDRSVSNQPLMGLPYADLHQLWKAICRAQG